VWTFPTLEPAIVHGGSFVLDRMLTRSGEVQVHVGDQVTPATVVVQSLPVAKSMTLFVAGELGVPNTGVQRYLTKPVGSSFQSGDAIARARRGLRTATVTAPANGTLAAVDETSGTVLFTVEAAPDTLHALVYGEVERVVPEHGATIRATGSRSFGILGFGDEAIGTLTTALDRSDRELMPEQVKDAWKGQIVVCGMTVGVPTLTRLKQIGVAGVIVGSLAEADIRRFLASGGATGEVPAARFWRSPHPDAPFSAWAAASPFAIVATEGFGRIPMAEAVFSFLREREGQTASVQAATCVGESLHRPEIYVTAAGAEDAGRVTDELQPGRQVRLVGSRYLGTVATCQSEPNIQIDPTGVIRTVAEVQLPTGETRVLPVTNLEVLS
jgi:hypothetical protein